MKTFAISLIALTAFAMPAVAGSTITVTHGKTPDPTYLDLGPPGDSVGDERIWQFGGKTADNKDVVMNWVMLTVGQPEGNSGLENRTTSAIFTIGAGTSDRIMVEGVGLYPTTGSTVKVDATLERAIIGGTGKYAGARGTVLTTHLSDGTWQHVLSIQ